MFGWGVKTISVTELAERMDAGRVQLIDVREPYEYAGGHVRGAVNVPLGSLEGRLAGLDHDADTFVICQSGHRSAKAARTMKRAGFEHAYSVAGGTSAWRGELVRSKGSSR